MMKRLIFLLTVVLAGTTGRAQSYRTHRGGPALHAFYIDIGMRHDPVFLLSRVSGISTSDLVPEKLHLWGYMQYVDGAIFPAGDALFLNNVLHAESAIYDLNLDPALTPTAFGSVQHLVLLPAPGAPPADSLVADTYVPLHIELQNGWQEDPVDAMGNALSLKSIAADSVIRWNADKRNTTGVYISIDYDPKAPGNGRFRERIFSSGQNYILVDDTGSATLPKALFKGVPKGARVSLTLLRGNRSFFKKADGAASSLPFVAYSMIDGDFRYAR